MAIIKKTFIDLFCGCGGFSLGAELAGYKNLLSIDIDRTLTASYKLNFPQSDLLIGDLKKIERLSKVLPPKTKPSLVIGGPPCQGFSFIGKRDRNDPRNELIYHFFRHVKNLRPDVFIMENVQGLNSGYALELVFEALSQLPGYYKVFEPKLVNAHDFGAATDRPRILIVGYDKRYTNLDFNFLNNLNGAGCTVEDAIKDLPEPVSSSECDFDWTPYNKGTVTSEYARKLNALPPYGVGWKLAVDKLKKGYISGITNTVHSPAVVERFQKTKQGENETISRYFKLKWSAPSKTLRAGTGREKGGFQAARPIHPTQPRVITVREAARIQSFPDWFVFHPTKWHSFRMIGNSVSPIMAKKIIEKL